MANKNCGENKYDVLIFDLDGTICNTLPGIKNGFIYALNKMNVTISEDFDLKLLIGKPLRITMNEYFFSDANQIEQAVIYYREYYETQGIFEAVLYDNVINLLESLRSKYVLYILTNKPTKYAMILLQHFNLLHFFSKIYGLDLNGQVKSKSELITSLMANHSALPNEKYLMIGDTTQDIYAAQQYGIDIYSVSYGYGVDLKKYNPTKLVSSVNELMEMFS